MDSKLPPEHCNPPCLSARSALLGKFYSNAHVVTRTFTLNAAWHVAQIEFGRFYFPTTMRRKDMPKEPNFHFEGLLYVQ